MNRCQMIGIIYINIVSETERATEIDGGGEGGGRTPAKKYGKHVPVLDGSGRVGAEEWGWGL